MALEIRKNPDPVLRKKTTKVADPLDKEIQQLIPQMFEAMRKAHGVGLAAPQIGSSHRLCVIEDEGIQYVLINPQITAKSKSTVTWEEGCLSFPGEFFDIKRSEEVKIRYLDKNGKQAKIKARGLLARALQHEIDHLDGILIIDRIKNKNPKRNEKEGKKPHTA